MQKLLSVEMNEKGRDEKENERELFNKAFEWKWVELFSENVWGDLLLVELWKEWEIETAFSCVTNNEKWKHNGNDEDVNGEICSIFFKIFEYLFYYLNIDSRFLLPCFCFHVFALSMQIFEIQLIFVNWFSYLKFDQKLFIRESVKSKICKDKLNLQKEWNFGNSIKTFSLS